MFRLISRSLGRISSLQHQKLTSTNTASYKALQLSTNISQRNLSNFIIQSPKFVYKPTTNLFLLNSSSITSEGTTNLLQCAKPFLYQTRSVTKFSLNKGKRKTVKAVIKRFKRLHWGAWIRTRSGRHKKLFKKSAARKRRLRQHCFVNATQSTLLDKMVTKYWKRPRYYVDDPYEPYHTRQEYYVTRKPQF